MGSKRHREDISDSEGPANDGENDESISRKNYDD